MSKRLLAFVSAALVFFGGYGIGNMNGQEAGYNSGYSTGQTDKSKELKKFKYTDEDLQHIYQYGYTTGYNEAKGSASSSKKPKASSGQTSESSQIGGAGNDTIIQSPQEKAELEPDPPQKSVTVYITKTGSKYHRYGCQYLRQSCISVSLDSAIAQGYTACSKCW